MRTEQKRIALFIDLENFVGNCLGQGLSLNLAPEIDRLKEIGAITIRRSFGDIYKLPIPHEIKLELRKMLQNNLIQHEDIPYQTQYKNSADIRLVIEAISSAYTNQNIDIVAVVASDRDYMPLFAKLREIGVEVIGIGGSRDNTPDLYVRSCDVFWYHENLASGVSWLDHASQIAYQQANPENGHHEEIEAVEPSLDEAHSLIVDAMRVLESTGGELSDIAVFHTVQRLNPDFDPATYGSYRGLNGFREICNVAAESNIITVNDGVLGFTEARAIPDVNEPSTDEDISKQLKGWLEGKLRTKLLSNDERLAVYRKLRSLEDIECEHCSLQRLNKEITNKLPNIDEAACFKVLYALYRANAFNCSPGLSPMNPIVHSLREYHDDSSDYDKLFIQNALRVFQREHRTSPDPVAWSRIFFDTEAKAHFIREMVQTL